MASMRRTPRGTYLSNGLRIVGGDPAWLTQHLATAPRAEPATAKRLEPGASEDSLFALVCTMESKAGDRPAVEWILDAVTDEVRRAWPACPRLVRDAEVEHPPSRFAGLSYRLASKPGLQWDGEIVFRSVHPSMAGVPITTQVTVEERPGFTRLGVRVTADYGIEHTRGYIGAGQAQPAFLQALRGRLTPAWMGAPLEASRIGRGDVQDFVKSVLEAPARAHPIVVLTPREEGGFTLDAADLAWELLGRARLYVFESPDLTFDLTDAVGSRHMSCFGGAARCYFPGWSRHDEPYDHPLLLAARIDDPLLRAAWVGEVGMWFARRQEVPSVVPVVVPEVIPPALPVNTPTEVLRPAVQAADEPATATDKPADVQPARDDVPTSTSHETTPETLPSGREETASRVAEPAQATQYSAAPPPADPSPALAEMATQMTALTGLVRELLAGYGQLAGEVERLGTLSSVRSSSTNAIERRLGRLEDLLEDYFTLPAEAGAETVARAGGAGADGRADSEAPDDGRLTLVDVVTHVAEVHEDALVMLDSAVKAAGESPYEDPERVRDLLYAMAQVARKRRDGALGTSLKEAFGGLGIDYRTAIAQSTPARLRQQYAFTTPDGVPFEGEEHIVLGNTYNPRRCLRIYFSSRVPGEARFVIGHVGRHFEVMTST